MKSMQAKLSKEQIAKKIIQECFWDNKLTPDELNKIVGSGDVREKKFLFHRILLNSNKLFADMAMFHKQEIERFIKEFKVPSFNTNYIKRRVDLVKVFFFDLPLETKELEWKK